MGRWNTEWRIVDGIMEEHLSNSEVCILLLSEKFEHSEACMDELYSMVNSGKPIIPICLNDYKPSFSIVLLFKQREYMIILSGPAFSTPLQVFWPYPNAWFRRPDNV